MLDFELYVFDDQKFSSNVISIAKYTLKFERPYNFYTVLQAQEADWIVLRFLATTLKSTSYALYPSF